MLSEDVAVGRGGGGGERQKEREEKSFQKKSE